MIGIPHDGCRNHIDCLRSDLIRNHDFTLLCQFRSQIIQGHFKGIAILILRCFNNDIFLDVQSGNNVFQVGIFQNIRIPHRRIHMVQRRHFFQFGGVFSKFSLMICDHTLDFFMRSDQGECQFLISVMQRKNLVTAVSFLDKFDFCVLC